MENIGLLLAKRAHLTPTLEAVVDIASGRRLTYAELNERTNRVANALLSLGVQPGDRVASMLMNSPEFLETFLAVAKIGAVNVPLNWRLVPDELAFILQDAGATVLIAGEEFDAAVADLHDRGPEATSVREWVRLGAAEPPGWAVDFDDWAGAAATDEPEPGGGDDDLLYIMYTSGTTGLPKGVMHSHHTALWAVITMNGTADLRYGDRYLIVLPLFHVGALTPATGCVHRGVTMVIMRTFDPNGVWDLIETERLTTGLCVPAMLNAMLASPNAGQRDHSSLRWIMSGASPVPVNLIRAYEEIGVEIHQVYGLTESCGPACLVAPEDALVRAGSTGKAFLHTDVRVARPDGTDCDPDEPGEVLVRGEHIMVGYWNRPDATAEAIRDGWLHTGDVAVMDADGFVYIQDRIKDMIISGGENIYPAELENVLLAHPKVRDVAVIGQPSARWGESPFAVVVPADPSLTEDEVLAWCRGKVAPYKLPKGASFVDEIPRNPSGKALKRVLRESFPGPSTE
jgi:acyl-CoA synthetase (AMP-forming)/AMP-acid ligase II